MQQFQNSEGTPARRHIYLHLVDGTDGITAETGLTGVGRISKNGATTAATSGSLVEIDSTNMPGRYYIILTATELNTDGMVEVRYKAAACAEGVARGQVVPWDPYNTVNMGLSALPTQAAEGAGGLYTRGAGTGQIAQGNDGEIDVEVVRLAPLVISTGAFTGGAINAASIASSALTGAKFGTDFLDSTKIADTAFRSEHFGPSFFTASGLATDAVQEIVDGILNELTASHVTAGTVGLTLDNLPNDGALTFLDASILARTLATASYFDPATDDVDVRSLQANIITAASIANLAIGSSSFAIGAITATVIASDAIGGPELDATAIQKIVDGILNELTASHLTAGTVGLTLDNLPNDGALTFLDQSVAANATPAEVLTQVNAALDAAITELSGEPGVTPSLREATMMLYMPLRNRFDTFTSGADALRIYNSAGSIIATKALTDAAGDYSEAKMT